MVASVQNTIANERSHVGTPMKPCRCGCGTLVHEIDDGYRLRYYVHGHNKRKIFGRAPLLNPIIPCSCGCGEMLPKYNKQGQPRTKYHHHQPKSQSHPNWKGGRSIDGAGYITVNVGNRKKVREHRLVMEQHLGRKLSINESVHHINENKQDNRIENLRLMTKSTHTTLHATKDLSGRLCSDCGSDKTPRNKRNILRWCRHPITKGWLCHKCYNRTVWNLKRKCLI